MAVTKQVVVSGLDVMVHFPLWHSKDAAGLRPIIACHGHGGQDIQIDQGEAFAGHPEYLADQGHVVAAISTGDTWANATAMADITVLYNYLITTLGATGPKVGLLCWSMGGGNGLRWMLENPTKVAAGFMCSPLSDLDWAHNQVAYATEMDAAYGGNYVANGSARSPLNNAAAFRGGPKILIAHATDDATLPYSVSTAFVAAVNDPAITLRQPDITGGHQGGLTKVKPRESWEFLRTQWAA